MMKRLLTPLSPRAALTAALLAGLAWLAPPARAGTVTATLDRVGPGRPFIYQVADGPPRTAATPAGVYNFTDASGDLTGDFDAFCIEIAQGIKRGGTITFAVKDLEDAPGSPMGQEKADLLRELWGRHAKDVKTADGAAAFQAAVWEITGETTKKANGKLDLSLTGGHFKAVKTPAWVITAQAWLNQLDGTGPKATNLVALTNPNRQDYVTAVAPVPGGLALGGFGAVLAAAAAWWRRRRALPAVARD
jgi:hypothetical protein